MINFRFGHYRPWGAFWSPTLYGMDNNFVDNPIGRYAIGNRTPDLQTDPDGGLSIHVQSASPGESRASNWLPSPADGEPFHLIIRLYLPQEPAVNGDWSPPVVQPSK